MVERDKEVSRPVSGGSLKQDPNPTLSTSKKSHALAVAVVPTNHGASIKLPLSIINGDKTKHTSKTTPEYSRASGQTGLHFPSTMYI